MAQVMANHQTKNSLALKIIIIAKSFLLSQLVSFLIVLILHLIRLNEYRSVCYILGSSISFVFALVYFPTMQRRAARLTFQKTYQQAVGQDLIFEINDHSLIWSANGKSIAYDRNHIVECREIDSCIYFKTEHGEELIFPSRSLSLDQKVYLLNQLQPR